MAILNVEFKAATNKLAQLEFYLQFCDPVFAGEDHQVNTYFNVPKGRLKLREGNIENALIQYERADTAGANYSDLIMQKSNIK